MGENSGNNRSKPCSRERKPIRWDYEAQWPTQVPSKESDEDELRCNQSSSAANSSPKSPRSSITRTPTFGHSDCRRKAVRMTVPRIERFKTFLLRRNLKTLTWKSPLRQLRSPFNLPVSSLSNFRSPFLTDYVLPGSILLYSLIHPPPLLVWLSLISFYSSICLTDYVLPRFYLLLLLIH